MNDDKYIFKASSSNFLGNKTWIKWNNNTLYFNDGKDNFIDITTIVSRIKKLEDEIRELQK